MRDSTESIRGIVVKLGDAEWKQFNKSEDLASASHRNPAPILIIIVNNGSVSGILLRGSTMVDGRIGVERSHDLLALFGTWVAKTAMSAARFDICIVGWLS
jgi:hypothetical protein